MNQQLNFLFANHLFQVRGDDFSYESMAQPLSSGINRQYEPEVHVLVGIIIPGFRQHDLLPRRHLTAVIVLDRTRDQE